MVGVSVNPSTVEHPNMGADVFAARTTSKGKIIGAYYGSLICNDLSKQQLSMK